MTRPGGAAKDLQAALAAAIVGDVRFDDCTRHMYATDASMYAIEPIGVVFPRDADDVAAAVEIAGRFDAPVLPRGAGTGLSGQTVGHAVVLDLSRHMHGILDIDAESRTARVQPGVVQDELNRAAGRHGLLFAPDTSTSNRATLGGMIGNNSCGARSAKYGMTIDHVDALDVVLSDASRARFSATADAADIERRARARTLEGALYREIPRIVEAGAEAIRTGFPPHWRRSGGYRLDRMLPERGPFDLSKLVVGSEGTLACVIEAIVRLVKRPAAIGAVVGHFDSVAAAIDAVEDARDCGATAIELVDRMILDLARRSPVHAHLTSLLHGEPAALLWIEFYADSLAEASAAAGHLEDRWRHHRHGYAVLRADTPVEQKGFRELRKAGLGLLMAAGEGEERSLAFVEDTAVDPARLGPYTERFAGILERHGLRAGFYGHASAGCLHVRPFMDLKRDGAVATMRAVAEEVASLVHEFGGMNSSEHGDGLARSEFSRRLFGDALYERMREVKGAFDPRDRMNPGKKVDAPRMTEHLREPALPGALPVITHFEFAGDMRAAANRCARVGACRKTADSGGTMCPSFMATREEEHSTRGRANALVRALSLPDPDAALADPRLHEVLDLCLECKACRTECPMSVDMAALKAEALAHRWARDGVPLRVRVFGGARTMNRIGAALSPVSNWLMGLPGARALTERIVGIDRRRPLPRFARKTLQQWFRRRATANGRANGVRSRGPVVLLADSFTSFTEPSIGRAAVELLERAGWDVTLAGDVCCGRALISKGLLAEAKQMQGALLARLAPWADKGVPIAGCEPSCVAALREELPALSGGDAAATVARRATMVDTLLLEALDDGALTFEARPAQRRDIVFHAHCHQKAAGLAPATAELLRRLPDTNVEVLDAGCCGMAGSFGFEKEHYDLSMSIGAMRLFPGVRAAADDAIIVATGVSCRQQIVHGTGRIAVHPLQVVRDALGVPAEGAHDDQTRSVS